MKIKIFFLFFLCLCFCLCFQPVFSMSGPPPEPELQLNLPKDKDQIVLMSIANIKKIEGLQGQMVSVVGEFRGWDDISEPAPYSRSDWIIQDSTGAVFVHGALPEGCDPMGKSTLGRAVKITGRVKSRLVSNFGNVVKVIYIEVN